MTDLDTNTVAAIAHLATGGCEVAAKPVGTNGLLAVSPNTRIVMPATEPYEARPRRKRAMVTLHTAQSFATYVNEHKTPATVVLGEINDSGCVVVANIDYHGKGADGVPAWADHTAKLIPVLAPQWRAWIERSGRAMSQDDLADFLDENIADVVEPAGADLLQVCRHLRATAGATVQRVLSVTGGATVRYTDEEGVTHGDGAVAVPGEFLIRVPVFRGGALYDIRASLRVRLDQQKLRCSYRLQRTADHVEAEARRMFAAIHEATGLDVLIGKLDAVNAGVIARHELVIGTDAVAERE